MLSHEDLVKKVKKKLNKYKSKKIKLDYSILVYDIETGLLNADLFRLGEQRIRHEQLTPAHQENTIICITAKWYGKSKIYVFQGEDAVEQFDLLARQADVCLGKNSDNFDVKHINTARMMQGLKPYPEWMDSTDDLQKQFRKNFALPSQSLDYISKIFGTGGKEKMDFSDWQDIKNYFNLKKFEDYDLSTKSDGFILDAYCYINFHKTYPKTVKDGKKALKKMLHYNKKDVLDTEAALKKALPYIKLKYNAATKNTGRGCIKCSGSGTQLIKTKILIKGKTQYQQFDCLNCNSYGGKAKIKGKDRYGHKVYGTMGP